MLLNVKNSSGKFLGRLEISKSNRVDFLDKPDGPFQRFVEESLARGIERLVEVPGKEKRSFVTLVTPIFQKDPLFPPAFKEYLGRLGFEVTEEYPEVEEEIRKLLVDFPADSSKTDILNRLPEMSYLEQTFILEELKKENAKNNSILSKVKKSGFTLIELL
ncbi:MAG: hypothetical protein AAB871_00810 [Patescibacteria group bacterium]